MTKRDFPLDITDTIEWHDRYHERIAQLVKIRGHAIGLERWMSDELVVMANCKYCHSEQII